MIRTRGIGVLLVAVVLFLLAGATRVGWILLFDAVLWGTIVVSAVMPWLTLGRPDVKRRAARWDAQKDKPAPTEGDAVEFEIGACLKRACADVGCGASLLTTLVLGGVRLLAECWYWARTQYLNR